MRLLRLALPLFLVASPALAQTGQAAPDSSGDRLDRIERQLRALQRQVFPDGGAALGSAAAPASPAPANNARLDALERRLTELAATLDALGGRVDRLAGERATAEAPPRPNRTGASGDTAVGDADSAPQPEAAAVRTATARRTATAAVARPATGNAQEDSYSYAYRLYAAKLYPEAQAELKRYVAAYPKGARLSYARNLLGRAYLDDGKPALASVTLLENYESEPKGARAAESLSWLGQALIRLGKKPDACRVYREFDRNYGSSAPAEVKARVAKGRATAACAA